MTEVYKCVKTYDDTVVARIRDCKLGSPMKMGHKETEKSISAGCFFSRRFSPANMEAQNIGEHVIINIGLWAGITIPRQRLGTREEIDTDLEVD
jgi:hypothetical protein